MLGEKALQEREQLARGALQREVLVENAYMIFPDQEAMLSDSAFRDELGRAVAEGVERFLAAAAKAEARKKP